MEHPSTKVRRRSIFEIRDNELEGRGGHLKKGQVSTLEKGPKGRWTVIYPRKIGVSRAAVQPVSTVQIVKSNGLSTLWGTYNPRVDTRTNGHEVAGRR